MGCIGLALPPVRFEVSRQDIRKYAVATGQRQARFLAGDEAPLMFLFSVLMPVLPLEQLREDGHFPDNPLLPELPLKRILAGAAATRCTGGFIPVMCWSAARRWWTSTKSRAAMAL